MSCNKKLNIHEMGVASGERGCGGDRKFSITDERKRVLCVCTVCVFELEGKRVMRECLSRVSCSSFSSYSDLCARHINGGLASSRE